jgi:hypothetical protein
VANPIIQALAPHVNGSTPRPLSLASFVMSNGPSKVLGVVLGHRDEDGVLKEIATYRLSPAEAENFVKYVDEARQWLESLANGVPA